ncbi:MAG: LysM peptidoglycan-binding domain-containing protein, partial [Chloroflexota bacterium]|nr:LysM peptidoglycan-binding domain-containing protein [Chloroflexota bacterium]
MRSSTPKPLRKRWLLALIAAMVLLLFLVPAVQAAPDASPQASGSCGYWYTVKSGDSWTKLASWTGVSVSALKAANPSHIHPYNWLYIGHTLWIPCGQPYPPHPPPPPHPPQPPHPP